ncbi:MAG: helix-turn-helix transcriptional regulator [Reyranellaceae bacterium]
MANNILRLPDVKRKTGQSRSTIYDKVQRQEFPAPVKIGERAVGWIEAEVEAWVEARIEERDGGAS